MSSTDWSTRSRIRFLHEKMLVFGYLRDSFLNKRAGGSAVDIEFTAEDQKLSSSSFSCGNFRQTLKEFPSSTTSTCNSDVNERAGHREILYS